MDGQVVKYLMKQSNLIFSEWWLSAEIEVSLLYNPVLKWSACHILISPNAIFLKIESHDKNIFFLISILNPSLKVNSRSKIKAKWCPRLPFANSKLNEDGLWYLWGSDCWEPLLSSGSKARIVSSRLQWTDAAAPWSVLSTIPGNFGPETEGGKEMSDWKCGCV